MVKPSGRIGLTSVRRRLHLMPQRTILFRMMPQHWNRKYKRCRSCLPGSFSPFPGRGQPRARLFVIFIVQASYLRNNNRKFKFECEYFRLLSFSSIGGRVNLTQDYWWKMIRNENLVFLKILWTQFWLRTVSCLSAHSWAVDSWL